MSEACRVPIVARTPSNVILLLGDGRFAPDDDVAESVFLLSMVDRFNSLTTNYRITRYLVDVFSSYKTRTEQ